MIQVIFRTQSIKLFVSINSTQAFYLSKVNWKIRSFFCFHSFQNLTWIPKFDMEKEIQNIDLKKATTKNTIPPKILKTSCNTFTETLHNLFNECLITDNFPDNLKLTNITPVFKNKDPLNKENYRPVSISPRFLKFLKNLCKNINGSINNFLSIYLRGYRKGVSTQLALLSLAEKWKKRL